MTNGRISMKVYSWKGFLWRAIFQLHLNHSPTASPFCVSNLNIHMAQTPRERRQQRAFSRARNGLLCVDPQLSAMHHFVLYAKIDGIIVRMALFGAAGLWYRTSNCPPITYHMQTMFPSLHRRICKRHLCVCPLSWPSQVSPFFMPLPQPHYLPISDGFENRVSRLRSQVTPT